MTYYLSSKRVTPAGTRRLSTAERIRIAGEIFGTYCMARWWLLRLSYDKAVERARHVPSNVPQAEDEDLTDAGVRLGNAVRRTLRTLPVDSRCLVTALVLTRMLARRGIATSFVLGVRAQPAFAAHAWLERESVPILPTTSDFHRLVVL
jgi:hypothetical protein